MDDADIRLRLELCALIAMKKGINHYGHTGSQRYLRWGHRS